MVAIAAALIGGVFGWLVQRTKGKTDQSVAVFAEWSKLNKGISDRLAAVEKEFADHRTRMAEEIEKLRSDHASEIEKMRREHSAEMEEMRKKHRTEMRSLRDQNDELRRSNDGLQRMIAQNSHSTAQLIEPSRGGEQPGKGHPTA